MIGCFFALCRLPGAIRAPRISRRLVEKRALWVDSAQKKKPDVIPAFLLHTCLSAEDRPKSASLPIYFLPHLDKRKPPKIPLSATQKSRATNPAFVFEPTWARCIISRGITIRIERNSHGSDPDEPKATDDQNLA